jgi:hypothetical protein
VKYAISLAALLAAASPACADPTPIRPAFTREQADYLYNLLDAGLKSGGIKSIDITKSTVDELTRAAKAARDADELAAAREKVEQADKKMEPPSSP